MKTVLFISFLILQFFSACTSNDKEGMGAENDVDAARNFIRSALDGNLKNIKSQIINDSLNSQYLDAWTTNYQTRMNPEEKRAYREASITIHNIRQVNDSTTIVNYSNSYKKQSDSLKVVRQNNNWLVDLKYSFASTDSLP